MTSHQRQRDFALTAVPCPVRCSPFHTHPVHPDAELAGECAGPSARSLQTLDNCVQPMLECVVHLLIPFSPLYALHARCHCLSRCPSPRHQHLTPLFSSICPHKRAAGLLLYRKQSSDGLLCTRNVRSRPAQQDAPAQLRPSRFESLSCPLPHHACRHARAAPRMLTIASAVSRFSFAGVRDPCLFKSRQPPQPAHPPGRRLVRGSCRSHDSAGPFAKACFDLLLASRNVSTLLVLYGSAFRGGVIV